MSIWSNIASAVSPRREASEDERGVLHIPRRRPANGDIWLGGGGVIEGLGENHSTLYRCVCLLAGMLASPRLYIRDAEKKPVSMDDPRLDVMDNTRGGEYARVKTWMRAFTSNKPLDKKQPQYVLRESIASELLITGNCFLLPNVREGTIEIVRLRTGDIGYMLSVITQFGEERRVAAMDLIHIPMPALAPFSARFGSISYSAAAGRNFVMGTPPAAVVRVPAETCVAGDNYVLDYICKSPMPQDAFMVGENFTENSMKNSQKLLSMQVDSPWPLLIGSASEIKHTSLKSGGEAAVALNETLEKQTEKIGRAFGVPPPLLGIASSSWAQGINQLNWKFGTFTAEPFFKRIEAALTSNLLPDGFSFWHDRSEFRLGDVGDLINLSPHVMGNTKQGRPPIITPQEMRDRLGLPPEPENGSIKPIDPPNDME